MTKVNLNKKIYEKAAIGKAITDYAQIAEIQLSEDKEVWLCSVSKCRYDESHTVKEFCNYVIDLMNCNSK